MAGVIFPTQCRLCKLQATFRQKATLNPMKIQDPELCHQCKEFLEIFQVEKLDQHNLEICLKCEELLATFKKQKKTDGESVEGTETCSSYKKPILPTQVKFDIADKKLKFAGKEDLLTVGIIGGTTLNVHSMGFGDTGVVAGSLAAAYQSAFLGDTVPAGSLFSILQSAGATGLPKSTKFAV